MIQVAAVKIWGHDVGAISWNSTGSCAEFEFENNFTKLGLDLAPLTMPLNQEQQNHQIYSFPSLNKDTFLGLPGLLADSLPDNYGKQLLNKWLVEQGREIGTVIPIERLFYTGTRGMGALEYYPPKHDQLASSHKIEIETLMTLANNVLSEKKKLKTNLNTLDDENLREIIRIGSSAGGARAKAIVAYNPITGEMKSGQLDNLIDYEYWIIKLDGVTNNALGDPLGYGKIEYAYYKMASNCAIQMSTCQLKEENKRYHFMTKRFDRDGTKKLHMQSLCGIAHYDYNVPQAYGYEQAFQIIRTLGLPYSASEELYRRMCFNVIARNQDDHTKNISFLMDENGTWNLSPAYDVTYSYNPESLWTKKHQMTINGKSESITKEDLLTFAKRENIKKPHVIIERINDNVSKWKDFAKDAGVDSSWIQKIEKNLNILE